MCKNPSTSNPVTQKGLYTMTEWDLSEDCNVGLAYKNPPTHTEKAFDKSHTSLW